MECKSDMLCIARPPRRAAAAASCCLARAHACRRYILADRFEEVTDPEHMRVDPGCDRTIYLYGYNRGTYMRAGQRIHVAGVGDFHMDDVSVLDDPCPLPSKDKDKQKRRTLKVGMASRLGS